MLQLLVFVLLALLGDYLSKAQDETCYITWNKIANRHSDGAVAYRFFKTRASCLGQCHRTANCAAAEIETQSGGIVCWIHDNSDSFRKLYISDVVDQYRIVKRCSQDTTCPNLERREGVNSPNAIHKAEITSEDDCVKYCVNNVECHGVDFAKSGRLSQCWVHLGSDNMTQITDSNGVVQYRIIDRCTIEIPVKTTRAPAAKGGTGVRGVRGPRGFAGVPGEPGGTGATGSMGLPGYPGAKGLPGATGPYPGRPGVQGVAGPPGSKGFTGATGVPGEMGREIHGDTGATGMLGQLGFTGFTGESGRHGSTGFTGPIGERGLPGVSEAGAVAQPQVAEEDGDNGDSSAAAGTSASTIGLASGIASILTIGLVSVVFLTGRYIHRRRQNKTLEAED